MTVMQNSYLLTAELAVIILDSLFGRTFTVMLCANYITWLNV